ICSSRRFWRSFSPLSLVKSTPSKKMFPEVTGNNWVISRPSVDFPQPDSPTRPTVSPGKTSKLTRSTALTLAPRPAGKCLTTSSARSSGARSGTRFTVAGQGPAHRHPAGRVLVGADVHQGRIVVKAALDAEPAAGMEAAAPRRLDQVRWQALDREQPVLAVGIQARD